MFLDKVLLGPSRLKQEEIDQSFQEILESILFLKDDVEFLYKEITSVFKDGVKSL